MKRLITNKKHDIHDARLVAEYNNGLDSSHAESCVEELYLNKSGEYFLYGRGGKLTRWSGVDGMGGEGIKPLIAKEAQEWIDLHSHDKYEYADLFGEAEE
jgi:hypothetical protein